MHAQSTHECHEKGDGSDMNSTHALVVSLRYSSKYLISLISNSRSHMKSLLAAQASNNKTTTTRQVKTYNYEIVS